MEQAKWLNKDVAHGRSIRVSGTPETFTSNQEDDVRIAIAALPLAQIQAMITPPYSYKILL